MIPAEKAQELINKYRPYAYGNDNQEDYEQIFYYKQCALIAVDEILNHHSQEQGLYRIDTYYWQSVKTELEKL